MSDFISKVNEINNKEDFIGFIELMISDLRNNPNEWENKSLSSYLEAIASWTEDMEGFYKNNNLEIPQNVNWKVFARILIAAKIYE